MKRRKKIEKTKEMNLNSAPKRTKKKEKVPPGVILVSGIVLLAIIVLIHLLFGWVLSISTAVGFLIIISCSNLIKKLKANKKHRRKVNVVLIIFLILGILGLLAVSAALVFVAMQAPKFDPALLDTPEVSILLDRDGNEFATLGVEQRNRITYDELPEVLIDAIIATEDSRFFQHNGFDAPRFIQATLGQLRNEAGAGGASTLSMQVIKNSFTSTEADGIEGLIRKATDIYMAVFKLEANYTKQQIIEFYANNHFLGGNIFGVQEAARAYFGKDVGELNLSEAAIIAGMFQSPNLFRPNINPEAASGRRDTVLHLMHRHGYITEEEWRIAASIPVEALTIEPHSVDQNPYQGYIDTVAAEMERRFGVNPYVVPVIIHTNMDRSRQQGVNRVFNGESYVWKNEVVQAGAAVIDTQDGSILAVGTGRNRTGANTFNYATDIRRQPGSSAKPIFAYAPGMECNDWSTATIFIDQPTKYTGTQQYVRNWDNRFMGAMPLREALRISRNTPALQAFQQTENSCIRELAENLGITPEVDPNTGRLHEAHSLGAFTGTSPLEMAAAYAAFGNGGYWNEPTSIRSFEYRETGRTETVQPERRRAMSDSTAFMITRSMHNIPFHGNLPPLLAAKTGTTNYDANTMRINNLPADAVRDSWVIGYSPRTTIGMWYGYDFIDSHYVLRNFPAAEQKDRLFLALVNEAMERDLEDFVMPDSVVRRGNDYFRVGTEPEVPDAAETLETPGNFTGTYNNGTVRLSWNAVSNLENPACSTALGYNVYHGNVLLGFTENTTFNHNTSNPFGSYRVVATHRGCDTHSSAPATFTLEEPEDNITSTAIAQTASTGSLIPTGSISALYTIRNNGVDITSQASNLTIVSISFIGSGISTTSPSNPIFDMPGTYSVVFSVQINGVTHVLTAVEFTVT